MPLYEYKCLECKRHTEKIQKFSDAEITVCPKCGGLLERVITAPAIAFKGGGWYADGYGNAKPTASGEGKSGESKSGESKSGESKSEGTPAASDTKSDSKPASSGESSTPASPAATPAPAAVPAASFSDSK